MSRDRNGCECEHVSHDGGEGHPYGQSAEVARVRTTFGGFDLCLSCVRSHHMVTDCHQLTPPEMCAACARTLGHEVAS